MKIDSKSKKRIEKKEVIISRVLFPKKVENQKGDFIIFKDTKDVTFIGNCGIEIDNLKRLEDCKVQVSGNCSFNQNYSTWEVKFDELNLLESDLKFFLTKIVSGLGKKVVSDIFSKYSEDEVIRILNDTPEKLLSIKGIQEKRLLKIKSNWNKHRHLQEIGNLLSKYETVTSRFIKKVYSHFNNEGALLGKNSNSETIAQRIKENPYIMTQVAGAGFKKIDEIALAMGVKPDSDFRLHSAIKYIFETQAQMTGDTVLSFLDIEREFKSIVSQSEKITKNQLRFKIKDLIDNQELVLVDTVNEKFANKIYFLQEIEILSHLSRFNDSYGGKIIHNIEDYLKAKEKETGRKLDESQKEAVKKVNNGGKFIIIHGFAGTGKTTTAKTILDLIAENSSKSIQCCALSGIAADRIRKTTGYPSSTIHSLLMTNMDKRYLPCKTIVIDEGSMINQGIYLQLLKKLSPDTRIIILGDPGQLPAIGEGDVFTNIIYNESLGLNKIQLSKIHRINENCKLADIAFNIRNGISSPDNFGKFDDYAFIGNGFSQADLKKEASIYGKEEARRRINDKIKNGIVKEVSKLKEEYNHLLQKRKFSEAIELFQVISPQKKTAVGTEELNKEIQKEMLLKGKTSQVFISNEIDQKFHKNDRVIHVKNANMSTFDYSSDRSEEEASSTRRVYNGMVGFIESYDQTNEILTVNYPLDNIKVFYEKDDAETLLNLAYAITIHKSQGMEYDNIYIPLSFSHFKMLNRFIIYTGETRSKTNAVFVGEPGALEYGISNEASAERNTVLNQFFDFNYSDIAKDKILRLLYENGAQSLYKKFKNTQENKLFSINEIDKIDDNYEDEGLSLT